MLFLSTIYAFMSFNLYYHSVTTSCHVLNFLLLHFYSLVFLLMVVLVHILAVIVQVLRLMLF